MLPLATLVPCALPLLGRTAFGLLNEIAPTHSGTEFVRLQSIASRCDSGPPFGAILVLDANGTPVPGNTSNINQQITYTGQRLDPETSNYYFKSRYYDPAQGKFISRDPLGYVDGMNFYAAYFAMHFAMDMLGLDDTNAVSKRLRRYLPPVIGVPLGGVSDSVGGLLKAGKGVATGDGSTIKEGLSNSAGGVAGALGLKEALFDEWTPGGPRGLAEDVQTVRNRLGAEDPLGWEKAAMNGHNALHAGSNAEMSRHLGPFGGLIVAIVVGAYHETPFDEAFSDELAIYGPVNLALDATSDMIANTVGSIIGLIVPPAMGDSTGTAMEVGNFNSREKINGKTPSSEWGEGTNYEVLDLDAYMPEH